MTDPTLAEAEQHPNWLTAPCPQPARDLDIRDLIETAIGAPELCQVDADVLFAVAEAVINTVGPELERLRARVAELEAEHERVQDFHHYRLAGSPAGTPARVWAEQLGDAIAGRFVAEQGVGVVYGIRDGDGGVELRRSRADAEEWACGAELVQARRGPWTVVSS